MLNFVMRNVTKRKNTEYVYWGLILVAPVLLFWKWVIKGDVLYWGALLLQFWPWHHLVKLSALNGEWPLWNPLLGNGTLLLANQQSAVFYPPNLIYLVMPVEHALTFSVMLHLVLAGWFMVAYMRYLGLSPFAVTVSALSFMFSGYIVGRSQFVTMVNAAAWFPLLLLLADKVATRRGWPNVLWLALALAIQLLAGHAQLWFYGLLLIGAYILFRSWQTAKRSKRSAFGAAFQVVAKLALAVFLSMLVAAVQLAPTAKFLAQSPRSTGAARYEALTYSFWPWRLVTLVAPDFFGNPAQGNYWGYANYWEDHAYIGVMPFVLALTAIWFYFRQIRNTQEKSDQHSSLPELPAFRVIPFFAALIPVSIILAMGWNTPIFLWLFDYVPGFGLFRAPARLLIWYTVAMSVLAGVGAHFFQLPTRSRVMWQRLLVICIAVTLAGIFGRWYLSGRGQTFVTATRSAGILLSLTVILLLLRPPKRRRGIIAEPVWQGLGITFVVVDLLLSAFPLLPMAPPELFTQPISTAGVIKSQSESPRFFVDSEFAYGVTFNRYFQFEDFGSSELQPWLQFRETLAPNFGVYANLPSANNNDPLVVNHWRFLTQQLLRANSAQQNRILSVMGVDHFVGSAAKVSAAQIYGDKNLSIESVPNAVPHTYFVTQADIVSTDNEALDRLLAPEFDSRQEVIIISADGDAPAPSTPGEMPSDGGTVVVNEAGNHTIKLMVDAPSAGYVILVDTFYPGWQATIDGEPAKIYRANLAFRAVFTEAGRHQVKFSYRPAGFTFGLWTTGITCLILIAMGGFLSKKEAGARSQELATGSG